MSQNRPNPSQNAADDLCHGNRRKEDDQIQSGQDTNELLPIVFCGRRIRVENATRLRHISGQAILTRLRFGAARFGAH